jgi:hypothetical protein
VRLARTFDAELDIRAVLPVPSPLNMEYQGELGHQAEQWLDEALESVPDDVTAHAHGSLVTPAHGPLKN